MAELWVKAPAKINWRLRVVGRRPDGYHLLSGLMQSISLCDEVYVSASADDDCRVDPPVAGLDPANNLALRAWLLLKRELSLKQGLSIHIVKRIPVGAGLAGGSTDAAAVLKGANQLFELGLSHAELAALGLKLGADVPFCLLSGLAKAEGVGEQLSPLPAAPPLPVLLVNPGFSVPTKDVFAHYRAQAHPFADAATEEQACARLASALKRGDIPAINSLLANDLAPSARQLYPQIGDIEQRLRTLSLTPLLCGSGGTVFALAESAEALCLAQEKLANFSWVAGVYTINNEQLIMSN